MNRLYALGGETGRAPTGVGESGGLIDGVYAPLVGEAPVSSIVLPYEALPGSNRLEYLSLGLAAAAAPAPAPSAPAAPVAAATP